MQRNIKEQTEAEMAMIMGLKGHLVGITDLRALYNCVVHNRRWYRRLAWAFGFKI